MESLALPSPSFQPLLGLQLWACESVSYCHNNAAKQIIPQAQWLPATSINFHICGPTGRRGSPDLG